LFNSFKMRDLQLIMKIKIFKILFSKFQILYSCDFKKYTLLCAV
jgi:hypothetical protein